MIGTHNWRELAACADVVTADFDPFFPETVDDEQVALEVCDACPSRPECLDFAVSTAQPHGIWGGYPRRQLDRLIEADRAGRTRGSLTHFNAGKDRCKHGHRFTKPNTYYDPSGRRQCRTCRRAAERRTSQERRRSA